MWLSVWARVDVAHVVVGILVSIPAAVIGAAIKGYFARQSIDQMKEQREEARRDRDAARRERQRALSDREKAVEELARRKAEFEQRQTTLEVNEKELAAEREKRDGLLKTLRSNDAGLWTNFQRKPPFEDFDARIGRRKPVILTVANNKGGVGKTTLVGNLLAYFDAKGKKVLAIDMDYQGSLSTMLQGEQSDVESGTSNVNLLLQRGANVTSLFAVARGLGGNLTRSSFVSAFYDLALFEDRLMVEWLLQEHGDDDVRYRLAKVLLQPEIQQRYDIVLIDVPPRLSAGTINALCTSTHVLIPTIFNPIAAEPVPNFLGAATRLLHNLNPTARFVGIVETMAPPGNHGQATRALGRDAIERSLRNYPGISILSSMVPHRVPIAEGGVSYLGNRGAREIFDRLGDEISERIGI